MTYLRGFIPWIAFAAVSSIGWQWGALAGLVLAAGLFAQGRRQGTPLDTQVLEISTIAYFVALTALSFLVPQSPVQHFVGALSMAWLALTAWGGLAVKQPFTLGIAKQQTPEEYWRLPIFIRINVVLTAAWAIAFTLTAAVLAVLEATQAGVAVTIPVQVAGFVLPAIFTAKYPERVRARQDA
jgi:archaellum biogenesis protein FlaJ (TadC family)